MQRLQFNTVETAAETDSVTAVTGKCTQMKLQNTLTHTGINTKKRKTISESCGGNWAGTFCTTKDKGVQSTCVTQKERLKLE